MSSLGNPQELVYDESVEDGQDDDGSNPHQDLTDHDVGLEQQARAEVLPLLRVIIILFS